MLTDYIRSFIEAARQRGVSSLTFYDEDRRETYAEAYQGYELKVDTNAVTAASRTLVISGCFRGLAGSVCVENFEPCRISEQLDALADSALARQIPYEEPHFAKSYPEKAMDMEPDDPGRMARELGACLEKVKVDGLRKFGDCGMSRVRRRIRLYDESGCGVSDTETYGEIHVGAEAFRSGRVQTARRSAASGDPDRLEAETVIYEAAREAAAMLEASPVDSGRYEVIFGRAVMAEMISLYLTVFCEDSVRKKTSRLAGRIGETVAAGCVSLVEEPAHPLGARRRVVDDEGTPAKAKALIENGCLKVFLNNAEEAKKSGRELTGNGFKTSLHQKTGIGVTNLCLRGEVPFEELFERMGDGLYIVSCDGMFAGADVVSGDFSLISKGYRIRSGKRAEAVNQITVAGNFFDMLKAVKGIGDDYTVQLMGDGCFIVPSVYAGELVVSGK